jgi:hypothetical protein
MSYQSLEASTRQRVQDYILVGRGTTHQQAKQHREMPAYHERARIVVLCSEMLFIDGNKTV